jgi:hypothetical protein
VWNISTHQLITIIDYPDFVWRVFLVSVGSKVYVVAFVSAEDKIYVSDVMTGELISVYSGKLIFAGTISLFSVPIVLAGTVSLKTKTKLNTHKNIFFSSRR